MTLFTGLRILVVEDEPIVGMMVEDMLAELGAEIVGPASTVEQAVRLVRANTLDAAILDVNLNGERSHAVAAVLGERGVPFILATGYDASGCGDLGHAEIIEKPFRREQLAAALERALGGKTG